MHEIPEAGRRYTTVKYRLYPNSTQRKALERALGLCRWLYNHLLAECKADAIMGIECKSVYEMDAMIKGIVASNPALRDVYSTCLRDVVRRVHQAMQMCTWNEDGEPEHLPRFKSETRYKSFGYRTDQGFRFEGDRLAFSKIGKVRYRNHHRPKGGVQKCCKVYRDARGRWHACVTFEIPDVKKSEMDFEDPFPMVGIDLGLKNIITDSNGESVPCPNFDRDSREDIERLQKRMSESYKGSDPWERARRSLAIIYEDNARRRRGFLHRIAHDIVKGKAVIVLENLDVKRMKEMGCNSAPVRDKYTQASWGELYTLIEQEAEGTGAKIVYVNPGYTSMTCSACGHVKDLFPVTERTYRCGCCGLVLDRDVNAARNILGLGVEALHKVNGQKC